MAAAAGAMGAATFLSRILGLVREQVFAYLFGASAAMDAFNIAFRIPNLLRDLFAEGAMSAALVPTFTRSREMEGERRGWRVAGLVFRALFVLGAAIAVLGAVFAEPLVDLYASAYRAEPGKFELTVLLTRVMFPFFPLVALAAAFMGVLNARGRFFMPAFSSALFNLASVLCGVALAWWGPFEPIVGMAIGVVVGGAVQAFAQIPALRRSGYRYPAREPTDPPWRRDPALRRMLALLIPGTIGLAGTQINILVNSILATGAEPGAVSWLGYAFRLLQFPIGIFGVSLAAATLPRVSALWARGEKREVGEAIERSLRLAGLVNWPAAAGLAALAVPILGLIFERGRFTPHDTRSAAQALVAYAPGLFFYAAVKILVPVFYALDRVRITVISSMFSIACAIALNVLLVDRLGFWALALGTSIAAGLNFLILFVSLRRLLAREGASLGGWRALVPQALHLLGALGMAAAVFTLDRSLAEAGWSYLPRVVTGVSSGVAIALGWNLVLEGLRPGDLAVVRERIRRRVSR